LIAALVATAVPGTAARARPLSQVVVQDPAGARITFDKAFGRGSKLLVVTKPWAEPNEHLISALAQYRIRLNKGGLRSGVVFLRSDASEAARAMAAQRGKVRYFLDPTGELAGKLDVRSLPAILLIGPDGKVRHATPMVSQETMRQIAARYRNPESIIARPSDAPLATPEGSPAPPRRPGIPPASGGAGRFTLR
jgi:hypothetical protein